MTPFFLSVNNGLHWRFLSIGRQNLLPLPEGAKKGPINLNFSPMKRPFTSTANLCKHGNKISFIALVRETRKQIAFVSFGPRNTETNSFIDFC